jgi:hypothetical protein
MTGRGRTHPGYKRRIRFYPRHCVDPDADRPGSGMGLAESLCASGGQRRPSLDEEKLSDGTIISNEKLPAPVFVFANRVRCTPGVDDDGGAVGCGSIKPVYW